MTRTRMLWLVAGLLCVALVAWVANNTQWAEVQVPMPLQGEAARNPLYAAGRLSEQLGARATWDRELRVPARDAVMVLADWNWSLSRSRRDSVKRWVEAGGRVVVDSSVVFDEDFREWSGIDIRVVLDKEKDAEPVFEGAPDPQCRSFVQTGDVHVDGLDSSTNMLCGGAEVIALTAKRAALWQLSDESGAQAIRVAVGAGHVTAFAASPFRWRDLFKGDHALLFASATELGRGDEVHLLSEFAHPSLLALTWRYGAPVVILAFALIGAALWRGSVRFGPLIVAPDPARRSIAEQIRGTGYFAAHHGGGEALHAATARALDEAGARRLPGYRNLDPPERVAALAALTGLERGSLMAAMHHPRLRTDHALGNTIAMMETARRRAINRTATHYPPEGDDSATLETSD